MKKYLLLLTLFLSCTVFANAPIFEEADDDDAGLSTQASLFFWHRYRANFGMEKVYVRFPYSPTVSQGGALLLAYSYDYNVLYSFNGYFPPIGNINPHALFDRTLYDVSQPPFVLHNSSIYQTSSGDWVLDYISHDTYKNLFIKSRTVVTPFNAYTLQCVVPQGTKDHFEYFLESFYVLCECDK